jgi:DNA primase
MAGRIPQTFIDDLLARTDIVDIIDNYVSLKKGGKNYLGLCPFHDEKTPSFTVSQDKQFYHCFGCGANGTAIGFLMEYNRMDFPEVVEELASKAGLEVPREGGGVSVSDGTSESYELMELIVKYYRDQLKDHSSSERAVAYLKGRGISGEIAARYELGYAPPGWDNLLKKFGGSNDSKKRLEKLGMIINRDSGGQYDRFRDRIIYPIRDYRGRVAGFGGRTMGDDTPKYLNSPETQIFHKGRELYGLYQARSQLKETDRVFVVEGYMDVIALAQFDIGNVVATLGVAATADHLQRIYRNVNQVVFCFDGDEAGRTAAWRAMEIALGFLREGNQAFFIFMPEGKDPDDFVRENGSEFFQKQENFMPLSDYLFSTLTAKVDLNTREGRSRLIDLATPLIAKIPQGGFKQLITSDLAKIADTPVENIDPLIPRARPVHKQTRQVFKSGPGTRTPVTVIIELLLTRPDLANLISEPKELDDIPDPGAKFLRELVELLHTSPGLNCAGIIENWRDTRYEARLRQIAADSDERISSLTDPDMEVLDALEKLRRQKDRQFRQKIAKIERISDLSDEDKERLRQSGKSPSPHSKSEST